jgi:hypothetical protein
MTEHPDHELEVLEEDQNIPPRPEELIADADRLTRPDDEAARASSEPATG